MLGEYKTSKLTDDFNKYKVCRNKLNAMIKKSCKSFNTQLFGSLQGDKKKWKFINNLRQSKPPGTDLKMLKNCFGDKVTYKKKLELYVL